MSVDYSSDILELFHTPKYLFDKDTYGVIGSAGDLTIGESVFFYLKLNAKEPYTETQITKIRYSALGSVMLIAAAEKLCSSIEGKTLQEALNYCDPSTGLQHELDVPNDRLHSVNFVIQAFFNAFESFVNQTVN